MKKCLKQVMICSVYAFVGCGCYCVYAGPTKLKDEVRLAERQADMDWKSSTNYLSPEAYTALLATATKLDDVLNLLKKKDVSDKYRDSVLKEKTLKIKDTK